MAKSEKDAADVAAEKQFGWICAVDQDGDSVTWDRNKTIETLASIIRNTYLAEHGQTGERYTVSCSQCGKVVSNVLNIDPIIRGYVQCPECVAKDETPQRDAGDIVKKIELDIVTQWNADCLHHVEIQRGITPDAEPLSPEAMYAFIRHVHRPLTDTPTAQSDSDKTGHPEDCCDKCGGPNPVWYADNDVWNAVVGDSGGILCPICFIRLAEEKGIKPTGWRLSKEEHSTPQPPTAPDEMVEKVVENLLHDLLHPNVSYAEDYKEATKADIRHTLKPLVDHITTLEHLTATYESHHKAYPVLRAANANLRREVDEQKKLRHDEAMARQTTEMILNETKDKNDELTQRIGVLEGAILKAQWACPDPDDTLRCPWCGYPQSEEGSHADTCIVKTCEKGDDDG